MSVETPGRSRRAPARMVSVPIADLTAVQNAVRAFRDGDFPCGCRGARVPSVSLPNSSTSSSIANNGVRRNSAVSRT